MKPDVQKALLATAGRYIRKLFGEVEPRIKALEGQAEAVTKLLSRIDVLEKALTERPAPEKGERGERGADAEPVLVADVVAELISTKALEPVLDLCATEAVAKHFEANPVRDGKDGAQGQKGEDGQRGADGKDGAGIGDLLIDRDGNLVATMTDGRTKALGVVIGKDGANGRDGVDGKDGLSFEHAKGAFDADRGFVLTLTNGERSAEFVLPYMRHAGFWSEGKAAKAGQSWTHDGALWIAARDTVAKPCLEAKADWILAARKGRDGKDGRNGIDKTASVKVDGNA